jgi:hypothetical protein
MVMFVRVLLFVHVLVFGVVVLRERYIASVDVGMSFAIFTSQTVTVWCLCRALNTFSRVA